MIDGILASFEMIVSGNLFIKILIFLRCKKNPLAFLTFMVIPFWRKAFK
jgi:hypothetical protein